MIKLTRTENSEEIMAQYGHLTPSFKLLLPSRCRRWFPGTKYRCGLELGHEGVHAAFMVWFLCAVWDEEFARYVEKP